MTGIEEGGPAKAPPPRIAVDLAWPLRFLTGAMFAIIVTLTIAQVVFRYVFDSPLIWSEELSKLLLVWMVFLGAAAVTFDGKHLDVDVVFAALPPFLRRAVRQVNLAMALFFLTALAWFSWEIVEIESWSALGALDISAAWVRLPATVGGALMILFLILRRLGRGWSGAPDDAKRPM